MTCWDVLGITPTNERERIDAAYTSQRKFATKESVGELESAYAEALREAGFAEPQPSTAVSEPQSRTSPEPDRSADPAQSLNARDQQVVREVVIQVQAMLNDHYRLSDPGVWRAILTEPPADRDHIREAVSDALYPQLKPLLDDGSLPEPVLAFLAQWFGWAELDEATGQGVEPAHDPFNDPNRGGQAAAESGDDRQDEQRPSMPGFMPAAIGWIVGLIVLTSVFSNLLGK